MPKHKAAPDSDTTHRFPVRIYYEDTDAGGIVYYANYLRFAERARTESLRQAGIDQSALMRDHQVGFVVRHCSMDFFKPAMLDDLLTIKTDLHDINRVSMTMQQTIYRGSDVLVTLDVKIAFINHLMKPSKLPDIVRNAILRMFNH